MNMDAFAFPVVPPSPLLPSPPLANLHFLIVEMIVHNAVRFRVQSSDDGKVIGECLGRIGRVHVLRSGTALHDP